MPVWNLKGRLRRRGLVLGIWIGCFMGVHVKAEEPDPDLDLSKLSIEELMEVSVVSCDVEVFDRKLPRNLSRLTHRMADPSGCRQVAGHADRTYQCPPGFHPVLEAQLH
jgi:hypothetical protein